MNSFVESCWLNFQTMLYYITCIAPNFHVALYDDWILVLSNLFTSSLCTSEELWFHALIFHSTKHLTSTEEYNLTCCSYKHESVLRMKDNEAYTTEDLQQSIVLIAVVHVSFLFQLVLFCYGQVTRQIRSPESNRCIVGLKARPSQHYMNRYFVWSLNGDRKWTFWRKSWSTWNRQQLAKIEERKM